MSARMSMAQVGIKRAAAAKAEHSHRATEMLQHERMAQVLCRSTLARR